MGLLSPPEDADPLSQWVALLKPRVMQWRVVEAHDAWALGFPALDAVVFGQLLEGFCHVERADGRDFDLRAGDFMLMASPPSWTARPPGGGPVMPFEDYLQDPSRVRSARKHPDVMRFMAGYFILAAENADLMAGLMPPVVHVQADQVETGRLGALLKLLGDEAVSDRPGRSLVLDRLLEITLVEALRRQPAGLDALRPGLLAGLAHPQVGPALRLIHQDAKHGWTVSELARRSGMSRSAFAARFTEAVGAPPIDYLLAWRMTLARSALAAADRPLSDIAELAGYQSVSAFSTAFSRTMGCSPTTYGRQVARPPGAA